MDKVEMEEKDLRIRGLTNEEISIWEENNYRIVAVTQKKYTVYLSEIKPELVYLNNVTIDYIKKLLSSEYILKHFA